MSDIEYARHAALEVTVDGHDVASFFSSYLLDFTFTDNSSGKADEVQITLHNRDGKFTEKWQIKKGMPVYAAIVCTDWEESGSTMTLPCGSFKIDEVEYSGPPDKVTIKAVSSALTGGLRETNRTRAWENTSLQNVSAQIASEYGLSLMYYGDAHQFKRQDQRNESDIAFLSRIASERGMHCKCHDGKLILFDAESAESQDASMSIPKTGDMYSPTSWSFKESSSGTGYDKVEVAYTDPVTGNVHIAEAQAKNKSAALYKDESKTLTYQQRAESAAEAARLGRAALHKANTEERTASIECMGCPKLVAGRTVRLEGYGEFSGAYFIQSATHKISGSGYTTSLELSTSAPTKEGKSLDIEFTGVLNEL